MNAHVWLIFRSYDCNIYSYMLCALVLELLDMYLRVQCSNFYMV